MKTSLAAAIALAALAAGATAHAQSGGRHDGRDRPDSVTFYELPNFEGRSITVNRNETDFVRLGFNDRAQSMRVDGTWLVCEHVDLKGRCETVSGDVRDLTRIGLNRMVSSARNLDDGWGGGRPGGDRPGGGRPDDDRPGRPDRPDWDNGGGERSEGRFHVFFRRPQLEGYDLIANRANADQFCRRQGLGTAVFFDGTDRARRAVDYNRRFATNAAALRDVLCAKR
ncbi:MAG TPA: beta/gamma crystallin-related protein [Caulobacteraceae bacterium]|nr:beta/gamma crystallin-related protein [Caulobacteraceae bacterium]